MDDELMRERARYEVLAALIDNYRRERDEARAEAERLSESAKAAWEAECVMREQRDRYHAEWKQERQEVERLRIERDEERAEVQEHREQLRKLPDANRVSNQDAYRRGAEAMREACATRAWDKIWDAGKRTVSLRKDFLAQAVRDALRALPIPEEP